MKPDDPAPAWAYATTDEESEERRRQTPRSRLGLIIFALLAVGIASGLGVIAWQLIRALR